MDNPHSILDFSTPLNIELFDKMCESFSSGKAPREIHDILAQFQQNPASWKTAPSILDKSKSMSAKMFALNVLISTIEVQWNVLPPQEKMGMKSFLESRIVELASNPENVRSLSSYLTKMNRTLVEIVKREWPQNWPNFISEVVAASKSSQSVCANNMKLLRLLSEEAFDQIGRNCTQQTQTNLQESLRREFRDVFNLCMFTLEKSSDETLLRETFATLLRFLQIQWIPPQHIFESQLIEALALEYFTKPLYRNSSLQCLVEIASIRRLPSDGCHAKMINMFLSVVKCSLPLVNPQTDINSLVGRNADARVFVQHFANFLLHSLRFHRRLFEEASDDSRAALKSALGILLRMSEVEDMQLFTVCMELWEYMTRDLHQRMPPAHALMSNPTVRRNDPRYQLYADTFHHLKLILMARLPRPKEVLIVQDENGNAVKQEMKETFHLELHKQMSKTLHMLAGLDAQDMRQTICKELEQFQSNHMAINFDALNSLCWSIGAIAGAMSPEMEKSFLVVVIKVLLNLTEVQSSKDSKAIIAACIMYVVRKYPRFLKKHWKFLKTVVRKLIEFLHETHPGVQDMSIETLDEICAACGSKFLRIQENDTQIFLEELMEKLHTDMCDQLNLEQRENLFKTWGIVIHMENDGGNMRKFIAELLRDPSAHWQRIMENARRDVQILRTEDAINRIIHLLRVNRKACSSIRGGFIIQMVRMYKDLLEIYSFYAQTVSTIIDEQGAAARSSREVRAMCTAKSEILKLVETFVDGANGNDYSSIVSEFVPQFLETVLEDYKRSVGVAREASCLAACIKLIDKLGEPMSGYVQGVFEAVFEITLAMIRGNMEDFPDHRYYFFLLIKTVAKKCFRVFKAMNPEQFQLVMSCVMWATTHIEPKICQIGLETLQEMLKQVEVDQQTCSHFYARYCVEILKNVLTVMTDTLHKLSFRPICLVLKAVFRCIQKPNGLDALYDPSTQQYQNNVDFIGQEMSRFLLEKYPNLTEQVVNTFLVLVLEISRQDETIERLENHSKDFLVQIKQLHPREETRG